MKKWMLLLLIPLWLLILPSCERDDDYSSDKYWVSLATVKTLDEQAGSYYMLLDNRQTLWPVVQRFHFTPMDGARVLVNYTFLSDRIGEYDHYVRVNSLSKVLLKPVIELNLQNQDSIGNDPVSVEDIWFSGKYLNVMFGFWGSGSKTHLINLVNNTTVAHPADNRIYLEIRHNAMDDTALRRFHGLVSFDLTGQLSAGQSEAQFSVKILTENHGEKNYTFSADFANWINNSAPLLNSAVAYNNHVMN